MKKKFIAYGMLILGLSLLTACSSKEGNNGNELGNSNAGENSESTGAENEVGVTSGGDIEEMMLDGDYTYVDNEILMEMLEGEWSCEEENYSLTIQNDYTMQLSLGEQMLLDTEISYVFLQPGEYQDVDINTAENVLQNKQGDSLGEIDDFYTEMDFENLEESILVMELSEDGETKEIRFKKGKADKADQEKASILDIGLSSVSIYYYDSPISVGTGYAVGTVVREDAKEYPRLQTGFEVYAEDMEQSMQEMQEELLEFGQQQAKQRAGEEYLYVNMSDYITGKIARSDTKAVSIFYTENEEWGGEHSDVYYWGDNYESVSGFYINIGDVVTDTDQFLDIVRERVEKEYADVSEEFYDLDASFDLYKEDPFSLSWLLGYEGITVFFNAYDLGPAEIGPQTVTIYFDEYQDLFEEEYTAVPDHYIIPVYENESQYFDFDGDGKRERFAVNAIEHSEGDYIQWYDWEVVKGNQKLTISNYDFSEDAYLIKANDQYYLYLFGYAEGDSARLNVVDLKNWTYDANQSMFCDFGRTTSEFKESSEQNISRYENKTIGMVDPEHLILSNRMEILGTYNGYKTYRVGQGGYPETSDDFYTADMYRALKAKRNIPCEYVDIEGKKIGDGVLDRGSYAVVMRTDGESWVDVVIIPESKIENQGSGDFAYYIITDRPEIEDYTDFIRIYTEDAGEYYKNVDGVREEDAFAGILYAG